MLPNSWEVTNLQFEARVNAIIPTAVRERLLRKGYRGEP